MLAVVLLTTLALQYAAATDQAAKALVKAVEGRSAGHGYGYGDMDSYGHNDGYGNHDNSRYHTTPGHNSGYDDSAPSYGNSYRRAYENHQPRNSYSSHGNQERNSGHSSHGNSHQEKLVPIQIPYLDRNGCTFPGDIVCDATATDGTTYAFCVLSDESHNLWKKPSMTVVVATCAPEGAVVLSDWCNDNERILRAAGLIREKKKESVYNHQEKYAVSLNPCVLVAPAAK